MSKAGVVTIYIPEPVQPLGTDFKTPLYVRNAHGEVVKDEDGEPKRLEIGLKDIVERALARPHWRMSPGRGYMAVEIMQALNDPYPPANPEDRPFIQIGQEHWKHLNASIHDEANPRAGDEGLGYHGIVLGQLKPLTDAVKKAEGAGEED